MIGEVTVSDRQQQVDPNLIEQARRQVNRLAEEIARLSETELGPGEYYGEFLQRVLAAIAAPAGAIWVKTAQGNLQLQYQIRMREVGLDNAENGRQIHDELLRQVVMSGKPALMAPQSGIGTAESGKITPGNPTNHVILLAPIMVDKEVAGLVEVWQDPNRGQDAQRGFLQFLVRMAALASNYTRNYQLRQMSNQQQVWAQLEAFTRTLHNSLNTTEVAYQISNEGRRIVECDRISVATREGGKPQVRSISGADVIEKRSNLVQLMRKLFDEVMAWDEKLVYSGTKDETLPPKILRALDEYLAESNSKLLVVMPLRDERETNKKKPPRSALMMECFEPQVAPEQLVTRLEVVAKHASSALYNATEYRRIPFRFLWLPMAKVQEGLGGKTKAITLGVTFGVILLIMAMIFVPYPLKLEANGELLPKERRWIFAPVAGFVKGFKHDLKPGREVTLNEELVLMYSGELDDKIRTIMRERDTAKAQVAVFSDPANRRGGQESVSVEVELRKAEITFDQKRDELNRLVERTNAILSKPGYFWIKSPTDGVVLTADFREKLNNRFVQPNEPLLRIGDINTRNPSQKEWEIELKIPQKHVGQVLNAYETRGKNEPLMVDFLLASDPTSTYKGVLSFDDISPEANPGKTDNNEAEPTVLARVTISGKDIPKGYMIPTKYLATGTGTEVHSRIRCGNYPMGYSMFYGVYEFVYEKVIFWLPG